MDLDLDDVKYLVRLVYEQGYTAGYAAALADEAADEAGILLVLLGRMGCDERWIQTVADVLAGECGRGKSWQEAVRCHEAIHEAHQLRRAERTGAMVAA